MTTVDATSDTALVQLPETPNDHVSEAALADAVNAFIDQALAYSRETKGLSDLRDAWNVFRVWLETHVDFSCDDWRLFLAWYVFHWRASSRAHGTRTYMPSICDCYLQDRPEATSPEVTRLVQNANQSPLDFYEIHWLPEFDCYYVKSLLLGFQHSFAFKQLPPGLGQGSLFFGKILETQADRGIIIGHSRPFSPGAKVAVAQLRHALIKRQPADFAQNFWLFDSDIFNLYHELLTEFAPTVSE